MQNGLSPLQIAAPASGHDPQKHNRAGGERQRVTVLGPSESQKLPWSIPKACCRGRGLRP